MSDRILEDQGILGDTNVSEFPLYFFPLENDVLSLELEDSFKDLYLVRTLEISHCQRHAKQLSRTRIRQQSFKQLKL